MSKFWNWKAALSSSLVRGLIFFFANLGAGWRAAVGAMVAEYLYRAIGSGFFGAITQSLADIEPAWIGAASAIFILPLTSHSIELLIHWLRHTPHLKTSIIASVSFTIVSTLFNFYAMRRGALLVGRNSKPFLDDLRSMPRVIAGFLACVPLWAWRSLRSREA